jgi:hypothetical protein
MKISKQDWDVLFDIIHHNMTADWDIKIPFWDGTVLIDHMPQIFDFYVKDGDLMITKVGIIPVEFRAMYYKQLYKMERDA